MTERPPLKPAAEKLLREIAKRDTGDGVHFTWETGGYYRLTGTDYRVARRTFFPLTARPYLVEDRGGDSPARITEAGRKYLADLDAAKPRRTPTP